MAVIVCPSDKSTSANEIVPVSLSISVPSFMALIVDFGNRADEILPRDRWDIIIARDRYSDHAGFRSTPKAVIDFDGVGLCHGLTGSEKVDY